MSEARSRSNIVSIILAVVLAVGGWFFFQRYEIDGLDGIAVRPKSAGPALTDEGDLRSHLAAQRSWESDQSFPPVMALGPNGSDDWLAMPETSPHQGAVDAPNPSATSTVAFRGHSTATTDPMAAARSDGYEPREIRIAAWSLAGFGREKLNKPHVMDLVARVVRTFDVIAVQDIMATERDLLPRMVEHINRRGCRYDFLLAPPAAGRGADASSRMAVLFDTARIVTDRTQFYTVADPDGVFTHDPIVGWFQTVGPPASQAWTFSLVNVHIDLANAKNEVALLSQVLSAVRDDGRHEDDVLLAGLFQADDAYLVPSVGDSVIRAIVRATPTDVFGKHQTSNILLPIDSTTEFLGGGGVLDFFRIYNLTSAQAEEVSPYLPVYGEFSPREGE